MGKVEKERNCQDYTLDYEENYHSHRHKDHYDDKYYQARSEVAIKKFFNTIDLNNKILDFGCGLGQNIFRLPNAYGYDISKYCIDFCKTKGIHSTNNLDEYEDETFDIVFSSHVLEHHPYPKKMLFDIHRKLKPNQDLILVIPFERHGNAKFDLDLNQHLYNWNFQNINNLLITSGFKIKSNRYIRGAGYKKLLFLKKLNFQIYYLGTIILSYLAGIKEMMVIAEK